MRFFNLRNRGFTLMEIIIVIAVIGILASVVIASLGDARKHARDTQRKSDLESIQLALRLYKEANGRYPDCNNGMDIGEGASQGGNCNVDIDDALAPYMGAEVKDPLSGGDYVYRYIGEKNCQGGINSVVIFAKTMELSGNYQKWKGKGSICGTGDGGVTNQSYGIILESS